MFPQLKNATSEKTNPCPLNVSCMTEAFVSKAEIKYDEGLYGKALEISLLPLRNDIRQYQI